MHPSSATKMRSALTLLIFLAPGLLSARPACELSLGARTPDTVASIGPWQYPDYPAGQCVLRLPQDDWVGNLFGHPEVVRMIGDFSGDGCDQDLLWRFPSGTGWILNKGLGGTELFSDGDKSFNRRDPDQFVASYSVDGSGREGALWSTVRNGQRIVYRLDGSSESMPDEGVGIWFQQHPEAERFDPRPTKIVAIGDSFTVGQYSDPLANFRERLWAQLLDFTNCGREIVLDWVGTFDDYNSLGEPLLYGNSFFLDKQYQAFGGARTCQVSQCIDAWMDGRHCAKAASAQEICAVEQGGEAEAYIPDIVLLMIGMNDLLRSDPELALGRHAYHVLNDKAVLPDSAANISVTMDRIRARNPAAALVLANLPAVGNPVGRSAWDYLAGQGSELSEWYASEREYLANKNFRRFNYVLQQMAVRSVDNQSPVLYVDQYSNFAGDPGVQWDRLHPSYGGHQQIADAYATALAKFWASDGVCALPYISPYVNATNSSFLVGDFDGDGCAQDVAYRSRSGQTWSSRWMIRLAGSVQPYALAKDAPGAVFKPGDLEQFVSVIDFDSDGLPDIAWRSDASLGWQINFGDPSKPSRYIADPVDVDVPAFDLSSEELVVMTCDWGTKTTLGWTAAIEADEPYWQYVSSDGKAWRRKLSGDWRNSPFWFSKGLQAEPPCRIVGNH